MANLAREYLAMNQPAAGAVSSMNDGSSGASSSSYAQEALSINVACGGVKDVGAVKWPSQLVRYGVPIVVFWFFFALFYAFNPVMTRQKKGVDRLQQQNVYWVVFLCTLLAIVTFVITEMVMKN